MNEKLETFKKELIDNADSFVTESAKEAVVNWLKDAGVPAMKEVADVVIWDGSEDDVEYSTAKPSDVYKLWVELE